MMQPMSNIPIGAPFQDTNVREQRLHDGCCPNCGTRLYKASNALAAAVGGLVPVPKMMFRKRGKSSGGSGSTPKTKPTKMTPLTVPGVAERGQCVKCANGRHAPAAGGGVAVGGAGSGGSAAVAVSALVPAVKAVPVVMKKSFFPPPRILREMDDMGKQPPPQSKLEVMQARKQNARSNGFDDNTHGRGDLKQPPEALLGLFGLNHNLSKAPPAAAAAVNSPRSLSETSSGSDDGSETDTESTDSEDDASIDAMEELQDMGLCRLESDHASSSMVNNLRHYGGQDGGGAVEGGAVAGGGEPDDRKPAAKPAAGVASRQIEESAERIRRLRMEAADIDMAFLESSVASAATATTRRPGREKGDAEAKLECPPGMSPEVFYQLPPEMQKEVVDQHGSSESRAAGREDDGAGGAGGDGTPTCPATTADIDPDTLASLPEDIRKEVLEQARRDQQQQRQQQQQQQQQESNQNSSAAADNGAVASSTVAWAPPAADETPRRERGSALSMSTIDFLSDCDIDCNDYENFPEEVKNDILEERKRRRSSNLSNLSGFDADILASLPEDVRKEVLDEERKKREGRQPGGSEGNGGGSSDGPGAHRSAPGAHSVNVPAGYDPDTYYALPPDVQRELVEELVAAQQGGGRYSAGGYDHDDVVDARVVRAAHCMAADGSRTGGTATSCTYEGDYNVEGKRHGDGILKWTNGDKYVGKFKDGYIEGRGTVSFHDNTEYAGQWQKNRFHGEGTRRFNNGNVYAGNYATGKRHGQGRCYFANGDMYVGDWKEDTIHGFGRYYYNNGHSFEGMFRNGTRNGRGKYQLTDGKVEIYRYVNDSRVGDGVRWSANRKKAWRMNDGKIVKKISMGEAAAIAKRCGPIVDES